MKKVAKIATDVKTALRHKRDAMPKYPIQREKFTQARRDAGYKSDAKLWEAAKAAATDIPEGENTADRSMINKILRGGRTAKPWEISAISKVLGISKDELMIILGIDPPEGIQRLLHLSGFLKEGGTIMLVNDGPLPAAQGEYYEAAYMHKGRLLRVEDQTMGDRYQVGDLVEYGEQSLDFEKYLRKTVVAALEDGAVLLRILHSTDRVGFYSLLPVRAGSGLEPIITDKLRWVAEIEAIYPPKG